MGEYIEAERDECTFSDSTDDVLAIDHISSSIAIGVHAADIKKAAILHCENAFGETESEFFDLEQAFRESTRLKIYVIGLAPEYDEGEDEDPFRENSEMGIINESREHIEDLLDQHFGVEVEYKWTEENCESSMQIDVETGKFTVKKYKKTKSY